MISPLEIADLDPLAHLLETGAELLDKVHLYIEVYGQIGILMSRVDGSADIEVDVGSLLEQHSAYERSAVALEAPFLIQLVFAQSVFGIFDDLVYRYDALCHQINALDLRDRRNVALFKIEARLERLAQIFGGDGRSCAAADDVLALTPKRCIAGLGRISLA